MAKRADDPVDRLFAAPPRDFVATRKAIAKELKGAGDAKGAAAIEAMRKPAPTAWAIDWVAREHASAMRALLDAADAVRAAQRKALAGDAAAFDAARAALAKEESRVMGLAREGMEAAAATWTPEAQRRIQKTLRALPFASDEERERVVAGRLEADLEVDDPFAAMASFVGTRPRHASSSSSSSSKHERERAERERHREREEEKRREREREKKMAHFEQLDAKARDAEAKARHARLEADKLAENARVARSKADAAKKELDA